MPTILTNIVAKNLVVNYESSFHQMVDYHGINYEEKKHHSNQSKESSIHLVQPTGITVG